VFTLVIDAMMYVMFVSLEYVLFCYYFFFFQAEDGIRDWSVTGVQTCALPILRSAQRLPKFRADRIHACACARITNCFLHLFRPFHFHKSLPPRLRRVHTGDDLLVLQHLPVRADLGFQIRLDGVPAKHVPLERLQPSPPSHYDLLAYDNSSALAMAATIRAHSSTSSFNRRRPPRVSW